MIGCIQHYFFPSEYKVFSCKGRMIVFEDTPETFFILSNLKILNDENKMHRFHIEITQDEDYRDEEKEQRMVFDMSSVLPVCQVYDDEEEAIAWLVGKKHYIFVPSKEEYGKLFLEISKCVFEIKNEEYFEDQNETYRLNRISFNFDLGSLTPKKRAEKEEEEEIFFECELFAFLPYTSTTRLVEKNVKCLLKSSEDSTIYFLKGFLELFTLRITEKTTIARHNSDIILREVIHIDEKESSSWMLVANSNSKIDFFVEDLKMKIETIKLSNQITSDLSL